MNLSKRTQLKHDKMIAEAEEDIRGGKIYNQAEVVKSFKVGHKKILKLVSY